MATSSNFASFAKTHDFCKVYLHDYPSHRQKLLIPPNFIKHFNEKIPDRVTLKDSVGNCWNAYMEEAENGLFIHKGWDNFVRDKSISVNCFLLFKYDSRSSSFTITIFNGNGCEREEDPVYIIVEDETSEEEFEPKRTPSMTQTSIGARVASRRKSTRSYSTGDKKSKQRDLEAAVQVPIANPTFCAYLCAAQPYLVNIPAKFMKEHKIKLKHRVRVQGPSGKIWPAACKARSNGMVHLYRLSAFMKQNKVNIEKHKLLFEFVLGKNRECEELKVQIKDFYRS